MVEKRSIVIVLVIALAGSASTWFYVNGVLVPQEIADAAAHNLPRGSLSDLYPRWLGARELLLHGRDPYGSDVTREIQSGYYGRALDPTRPNDPKDHQAFAYPLYVVLVLAPTVKLPFDNVRIAFWWMLFALTTGSVPLWMRVIGWRASILEQLIWILLALGCFPAVQGLKLQQLTLLVAALIAASVTALIGEHLVWAGILLALATIKPQLVFLLVTWLLIWVLGNWRARRNLCWSFIASMAVLVVASELLLPGWIREFRAAVAAYYRYTDGGQSVLDLILSPRWGRILAGLIVILSLALLWRLHRSDEHSSQFQWSISLVLAVTVLVIRMSPYNQILLLPAVMLIVRSIARLWESNLVSRFLVFMAGVSILWPYVAAAGLVIALVFLPAEAVRKEWAVPLFTSPAIPIAMVAMLVAGRRVLRSKGLS